MPKTPKLRLHIDRLRLDDLSPTQARAAEAALRQALAAGLAQGNTAALQSSQIEAVRAPGTSGADRGAGTAILQALGRKGPQGGKP